MLIRTFISTASTLFVLVPRVSCHPTIGGFQVSALTFSDFNKKQMCKLPEPYHWLFLVTMAQNQPPVTKQGFFLPWAIKIFHL